MGRRGSAFYHRDMGDQGDQQKQTTQKGESCQVTTWKMVKQDMNISTAEFTQFSTAWHRYQYRLQQCPDLKDWEKDESGKAKTATFEMMLRYMQTVAKQWKAPLCTKYRVYLKGLPKGEDLKQFTYVQPSAKDYLEPDFS